MDQATDHLQGIVTIHDDICAYGHTHGDHDQYLFQLMKTAKQHGIVFNSSKCQIRQPQIAFYGAVFTAQGMWPDPLKIQASKDLSTPNFLVKLQSFLCLILPAAIHIQSVHQNNILMGTVHQMGLESLDGCSLPAP